jgi:hypothetical protein
MSASDERWRAHVRQLIERRMEMWVEESAPPIHPAARAAYDAYRWKTIDEVRTRLRRRTWIRWCCYRPRVRVDLWVRPTRFFCKTVGKEYPQPWRLHWRTSYVCSRCHHVLEVINVHVKDPL